MEILGYIASVFIGISLGLIGAGGSILTVPVMVYFFHIAALPASSYSLFIVGFTSLFGTLQQYQQGNINHKIAIFFCLISLTVVSVVRMFIIPAIPYELFVFQGIPVTSSVINLILFSGLMIIAGYSIIKNRNVSQQIVKSDYVNLRLLMCGITVGLITGLLGAGGGFIMIPVLVMFLGVPIKEAIGTSLLIIALNSLIGFAMDLNHFDIDWKLLAAVTMVSMAGIFIGLALGKRIPAYRIKVAFGWFVLAMGILIFIKELLALTLKFMRPMVS